MMTTFPLEIPHIALPIITPGRIDGIAKLRHLITHDLQVVIFLHGVKGTSSLFRRGFVLSPKHLFLRNQPITVLGLFFDQMVHVLAQVAVELGEKTFPDFTSLFNNWIAAHSMSPIVSFSDNIVP
jgi:hypothetical protein